MLGHREVTGRAGASDVGNNDLRRRNRGYRAIRRRECQGAVRHRRASGWRSEFRRIHHRLPTYRVTQGSSCARAFSTVMVSGTAAICWESRGSSHEGHCPSGTLVPCALVVHNDGARPGSGHALQCRAISDREPPARALVVKFRGN